MGRARVLKNIYILIIILFSSALTVNLAVNVSAKDFRVPLQIKDAKSNQVKAVFKAELALTPQQRAKGLMFRESMDPKNAMLFVFKKDVRGAFWMKNTFMSLDIIFISADKKVINIHQSTQTESTELLHPKKAYRYVVEVNSGLAKKFAIQSGDLVEF